MPLEVPVIRAVVIGLVSATSGDGGEDCYGFTHELDTVGEKL